MIKLIQKGNSKLHNCYMFNVPSTMEVCGRICKGCYAIREQVRFPAALLARERRYEASKGGTFAYDVVSEIRSLRKAPKYFRIHASGEFYSQEYVDKWVTIIESVPDVRFYAYTKRLQHFDFSRMKALSNMVLIDSLHFTTLNYGPAAKAPIGAFVCPSHDKDTKCGETCNYCMRKPAQANGVFFVQH